MPDRFVITSYQTTKGAILMVTGYRDGVKVAQRHLGVLEAMQMLRDLSDGLQALLVDEKARGGAESCTASPGTVDVIF